MKNHLIKCLIALLVFTSCKTEPKEVEKAIDKSEKSKLISIQQKIRMQKDNSDTKLLLNELSEIYPKKYTCSIVPDGIVKGDINGDGFEDVLFRYTVDDMENQTWVACGWYIAFSNNKIEFEKLKDSISRFLESYRNSIGLNYCCNYYEVKDIPKDWNIISVKDIVAHMEDKSTGFRFNKKKLFFVIHDLERRIYKAYQVDIIGWPRED
jgi:hypothetical protein